MVVAANSLVYRTRQNSHYSLSDTISNRTRKHLQFKTIPVSQRRNDVIFVHIIPEARLDELVIFVMGMFAILMPSLLKQVSAPHVKTIFPMTKRAIHNFYFDYSLLLTCQISKQDVFLFSSSSVSLVFHAETVFQPRFRCVYEKKIISHHSQWQILAF